MIDSLYKAISAKLAILISYPTSVNNQEILITCVHSALQEQLEDNLMVTISWAWYNVSYTMAAKPIKCLELHYTMIQFLIACIIGNYISVHTFHIECQRGSGKQHN